MNIQSVQKIATDYGRTGLLQNELAHVYEDKNARPLIKKKKKRAGAKEKQRNLINSH